MVEVYKVCFYYIGIFFLVYLFGYATFLFLSVIIGSTTLYTSKKKTILKNQLEEDYYIPVSIIVPAYNEEVTIVDTIKSLLMLNYSLYEIIIVDDGSEDDTSEKVIDAFNMKKIARPIPIQISCQELRYVFETKGHKVPITLIKKNNGGKADALNMGINAAQYPYFVCMDADSVLQHDSLEKIMKPILEYDNVVAVGGVVRPCNDVEIQNGKIVKYQLPRNVLACMQVLEYDRSFLAARILLDKFNGNIIISGAFGLFKKETVIAVGGYDTSTMGEDMELVMKLHVFCKKFNKPYVIKYASDAICWSQAPEKLKDLCKQRRRWHIGLFQTMMRYRTMFASTKYGLVGMISYMYFLMYELLSPYVEIFGVITVIIAIAENLINVPFMISFFLIYALYSAILSLTAFFSRVQTIDLQLKVTDVLKAVLLCFFEISFLRFIIAWVRTTALIGYKKKKKNWGRIERKKINVK